MIYDPKKFVAMWSIWRNKGHQPTQKLKIFESVGENKIFYSIGLLDYQTLENYCFPSQSVFANYEGAFADIGHVLDKAER